jgi:glutathione peroxidase
VDRGTGPVDLALVAQAQPSWNFAKYLVGKDGRVVKFYSSRVRPDDAGLRKEIESALAR